jgi:hypothetical protein
MENEIFEQIQGFEHYTISNFGNVVNKKNNKVSGFIDKDGYLKVALFKNKKIRRNFFVHRLVAIHFVQNPEKKPEVNHKDGDKSNIFYRNLEWSTRSENQQHAYDTGLQKIQKGEERYNSKLTNENILFIRKNKGVITQQKMGDMFGVNRSLISNIINNKKWKNV